MVFAFLRSSIILFAHPTKQQGFSFSQHRKFEREVIDSIFWDDVHSVVWTDWSAPTLEMF